MGKLLYLLTFIGSLDQMYYDASDTSRRALLETTMLKTELEDLQDDVEKEVYQASGLTKDDLAYAAYAYPLVAGKLSSKPFKNFKYQLSTGFVIRPELEYSFRSKDRSAFVFLIKEF